MSSRSSGSGAFWLIVIAIGLALCYSGVFFQTGAQFYDTCWKKAHANGREPDSPAQAAQWAACEETANAALFNAGFVFSGNPEYAVTPQLKAMIAACPSNYTTIPISGAWALAVDMIQNTGGPTLGDRITPASSTILRVFERKWPSCAATALMYGFPKIAKQRDGSWAFGAPCAPCKAEEQAILTATGKAEQQRREGANMSDAEKQKEIDKEFDALRSSVPAAAGQHPETDTKN